MATTPKKLASQIIRLLEAGPKGKDSKLSEKYIQTEILQVINKILKTQWYADRNAGEGSAVNHLCVATYSNVTVSEDSDRGKCYATLPASPEPLPGGLGVQWVKPWKAGHPGEERQMIPLAYGDLELLGGLNVGAEIINDQWCYELDRSKIWFSEKDNETLVEAGITAVEMGLVIIDPATYGDNDTLPISPSQEAEVIREVLTLHGYNPAQVADVLNDGNPNRRQ